MGPHTLLPTNSPPWGPLLPLSGEGVEPAGRISGCTPLASPSAWTPRIYHPAWKRKEAGVTGALEPPGNKPRDTARCAPQASHEPPNQCSLHPTGPPHSWNSARELPSGENKINRACLGRSSARPAPEDAESVPHLTEGKLRPRGVKSRLEVHSREMVTGDSLGAGSLQTLVSLLWHQQKGMDTLYFLHLMLLLFLT